MSAVIDFAIIHDSIFMAIVIPPRAGMTELWGLSAAALASNVVFNYEEFNRLLSLRRLYESGI
jgi:hypothetical protein